MGGGRGNRAQSVGDSWLLEGGTLLDGRGGEAQADVLVRDGRIAAVLPRAGSRSPAPSGARGSASQTGARPATSPGAGAGADPVAGEAQTGEGAGAAAGVAAPRLDCRGLFVAPGFVDAHTHDDTAAGDPARYEAKIRQGITTSVVGQDGFAWAPLPPHLRPSLIRYWRPVNGLPVLPDGTELAHERLSGYLDALRGSAGIHVAALAGHANLRLAAAGWDLRPLRPSERSAMGAALEAALEDGARGLSTGLTYIPACASDIDELVDLARRLSQRRLPYVSHMRGYGTAIFAAAQEAIEIGRRAGCPVHLSHLHLSDRAVWGAADRLIDQLERAIAGGVDVTWDLYPYQAGSSVLYQYLPEHLQAGGPDAFLRRLADPGLAAALAADVVFAATDWSRYVISHTASGRLVGGTVAQAAKEGGAGPAEAIRRLLLDEDLDVGCVVHQTSEEDDRRFLAHRRCAIGSDGIFAAGRPHPRAAGAFARYWRQFVTAPGGGVTPGEAAAAMSGRAAAIHRLVDRGEIRVGAVADVAVFDGARFADAATYEEPTLFAEGMRHVLVAGFPVLRDGVFDPGIRAGTALA